MMRKKVREIELIAIDDVFFKEWIFRLIAFPFEILQAMIGIIFQDVFITVGGCTIDVGAPEEWISKVMLPDAEGLGIYTPGINISLPLTKNGTWNYDLIGPHGWHVNFYAKAEQFLARWMEILKEIWLAGGGEEPSPFSMMFVHNHPVIRPGYLNERQRKEMESAYDLSESFLPFSEWLKNLHQKLVLSENDAKVIWRETTDGVGILVQGADKEDLDARGLKNFIAGFQIREKRIHRIPIVTNYPNDIWGDKDYEELFASLPQIVKQVGKQAMAENSLSPTSFIFS